MDVDRLLAPTGQEADCRQHHQRRWRQPPASRRWQNHQRTCGVGRRQQQQKQHVIAGHGSWGEGGPDSERCADVGNGLQYLQ